MTFSGVKSDLHLGNQKVTWKKLVGCFCSRNLFQIFCKLFFSRKHLIYLSKQDVFLLVIYIYIFFCFLPNHPLLVFLLNGPADSLKLTLRLKNTFPELT